MSAEQFEQRALASLKVKGGSPSARHDAAILEMARKACGEIRARRKAARRLWWIPLSVAAAVGVIAVGLWSTIDRSSDRSETLRGDSPGSVLPTNGAALTSAPRLLNWNEQPGATAYRVTLRAADARILWQSDSITASEIELPKEASVTVGATYLWSVDYDGPVASGLLGPYSFSIAAPAH